MNQIEKLFELIPKLQPIEFVGLARLLKVELIENEEPRSFIAVTEDVLANFSKLGRGQKRTILRMVKAASKKDADNS